MNALKNPSPKFLICELCSERIALFNPDRLSTPISGGMFLSPDSQHGIPEPFHQQLTWVNFKCPYCKNRPILQPDRVLTESGYFYLVEMESNPERLRIVCPKCFLGLDEPQIVMRIRSIEDRGEQIPRLMKIFGESAPFCPDHGFLNSTICVNLAHSGPFSESNSQENSETISQFRCELCERNFSQKRFLAAHMRSHK